ncbi:peptide MFS transporter [Saprospira grandis]|uniref:peptide MFS transporter n=1 Tax=Saprospira grandis TaxID=1008 RepID=UPI0022DDB97D|nr:peptide MFS transporter [Saprospira grandis]WBM75707.1 peptide MFS transporter [Saprospira grandis]
MHPYTIMTIAWVASIAWIAFVILTNRKAHPKALFYLFFVEMWERFSYYGMRALLVLYMTKGMLEYDYDQAYSVYGAYGSMVYATPLIGGLLAERFMGYRKAIMWGVILIMIGHFLMAFEHEYIFLTALAMLILGNGFFKPNISSMIGKFYSRTDPRRDGAFTLFYMGINIGAFLSGLTCGVVGEIEGWHWGFSLAGVGMLLGLIIFWMAQRSGVLEDKGYAPHEAIEDEVGDEEVPSYTLEENASSPKLLGLPVNWAIYIVSLLVVPLVWFLLQSHGLLDVIVLLMGCGMIGYLIFTSLSYDKVQRERLWVVLTLFFFTIIFWTFFELAGSALTVFTDNNVAKTSFLTTTMFQSLNPLYIMMFAPVFSFMWIQLAKAKKEPAAPVKFGIALVLLGAGFLVLKLGEGMATAGMIPAIFMALLYLLHTLGELALSPVGLSLVTKLSPAKVVGFIMGFWLMSTSFAHLAGAKIAQMTNVDMSELMVETERLDRFNNSMENEDIKTAMLANKEVYKMYVGSSEDTTKMKELGFTAEDALKTHSVQEFVLSDFFLAELNKNGDKYHAVTVADKAIMEEAAKQEEGLYKEGLIKKAKISFLSTDASLKTKEPKQFPKDQIEEMMAASPNAAVSKTVAEDTLVICINVFMILGFVAIGGGVFLILLSGVVKRWMHGIN